MDIIKLVRYQIVIVEKFRKIMGEKMIKTNAMRILDKMNIEYDVITYDIKDNKIDGISVANKIGRDEKCVYKTLATHGVSKNIYILVIPVSEEIDFKKAAKVTNEKSIEMLDLKDLQKYTGYIFSFHIITSLL